MDAEYEILVKEMGTVILNSPFKKDMEEEFGSILIQNRRWDSSFP